MYLNVYIYIYLHTLHDLTIQSDVSEYQLADNGTNTERLITREKAGRHPDQ